MTPEEEVESLPLVPHVSEIQMCVTEPLGHGFWWHRDNYAPGLTFVIPLTLNKERVTNSYEGDGGEGI